MDHTAERLYWRADCRCGAMFRVSTPVKDLSGVSLDRVCPVCKVAIPSLVHTVTKDWREDTCELLVMDR